MRILSPTAILGYGFPMDSFREGLNRAPDVIAVDAGSTDPGPFYLGSGNSFTDRGAVKRDLALLLEAALGRRIPLVIGTAGGSGGEPHLARDLGLIKEIAWERGFHFKLALIHAEIDHELVREYLNRDKIVPLGPAPTLAEEELNQTVRIVGQMGIEPLAGALETGADVVLAGRAYDPAVFAAPAVLRGFRQGPSVHLGKILECGAIAAVPGSGSDCLMGYLTPDYFEVEPLSPALKCTAASVAAHTLYEKSNPVVLPGPGGRLVLSEARFEEVGESRVRVTGSRFIPSDRYYIKLEGVKKAGFRTVAIAGCRDPFMIKEIDHVAGLVKQRVKDNFSGNGYKYLLEFRLYGHNAVMGPLEPLKEAVAHELGIVIEVVGESQDIADTICSFARSTMLHCSYPGRIASAGNLAFPFSPSEFKGGEVYRFSVYHLVEAGDPFEFFPLEIINI